MMNNWKFLLSMIIILVIVYLAADFFRPVIDNSKETKDKIDSLNKQILFIQEHQLKLDSTITLFNDEINNVDSSIRNIKGQKTIIKEFYHEKINNVSTFDNNQIDSFFTNRYGH